VSIDRTMKTKYGIYHISIQDATSVNIRSDLSNVNSEFHTNFRGKTYYCNVTLKQLPNGVWDCERYIAHLTSSDLKDATTFVSNNLLDHLKAEIEKLTEKRAEFAKRVDDIDDDISKLRSSLRKLEPAQPTNIQRELTTRSMLNI
jgi:hypothetical protein